jgi:hypothetical protein
MAEKVVLGKLQVNHIMLTDWSRGPLVFSGGEVRMTL